MGKEPKSRIHTCPQCDYKAGNASHLRTHVRTVHEQRRDHVCRHCAAAFGQANHLTRHVRTVHEQRRDHACSQCDAAFGEAGSLRKHVRTMHNAEAEKKKKARAEEKAKEKARIAEEKAMADAEKRKNPQGRREVNKVLHKRARAEAESFERRMYENQEQMTEQERAILAIRPAFVASNRNNSSYYAARSDVSMVKNWVAAVPAFIPFFG